MTKEQYFKESMAPAKSGQANEKAVLVELESGSSAFEYRCYFDYLSITLARGLALQDFTALMAAYS